MRKLYVLNFDSTRVDTSKLHDAIKSSKIILNWTHYLPDSYILQSESTAKELSMELRKSNPGFRHYIFRLHKNYYGFMPNKQWEWLDNRNNWWD